MSTGMDVEDAQNVLRNAESDLDHEQLRGEIKLNRVIEAGLRLSAEVSRLERELERANARARASAERSGRPDVEGYKMDVREGFGGPRHYLAGRAVHAGEGLCLLTPLGWLLGRYESSQDRDGELVGWFYFALPGCGWRDFSIPIEPAMRLAWPNEVQS